MSDVFVLDACVALSWVLPWEATPRADDLLARVGELRFLAPAQFRLEVRSGLLKAERRGRSTEADSAVALALFASLPLDLEAAPDEARLNTAFVTARRHKLSIYDALYLDLALRTGTAIASRDERLLDAAKSVGVDVYNALQDKP